MNAQLSMFDQTTSEATGSATSSPASGSGATPSGSQDGPTTSQSGPEAAPAKASALPGARAVSTMSAISGRTGSGLRESKDLTLSLASRLQARTALLGSTLFVLTWKQRVTASGRSIPALRASAPRTSDSACSSWPTPTKENFDGGDPAVMMARRERLAEKYGNNGFGLTLGNAAALAAWPTPNCPNGGRSLSNEQTITMKSKTGRKVQVGLENVANLTSWATPKATDGSKGGPNQRGSKGDFYLPAQAAMASWATPASRDAKGANSELHVTETGSGRKHMDQLANQAVHLTASGRPPTGSPASTEKRGQLNPALPRWLMGLPPEWDACAPTVTLSSRRSRQSSSAPTESAGHE